MCKNDEQDLMDYINAVSFAIDDVKLYLDTHPCDLAALQYYEKYRVLRKQAVEQYNNTFGPLTADAVDICDCNWTWIKNPWPWEGGC